MLEKLLRLGFSEAICTYSIDKTAEVMRNEINRNADLAVAVLAELRDESNPYPVTKENYESQLQDWIQRKPANGIHAEQAKQMIAPFKETMLSLFID